MSARRPSGPPRKNRQVFDAQSGSTLPGVPVRAEGEAATGDAAATRPTTASARRGTSTSTSTSATRSTTHGMALIATVHYGRDYDNAFWNGAQMVFGDGDGTSSTASRIAVDVIGHELTHGVTADDGGLDYQGQPGALNESISDVFGSLVKQYVARPQQTADAGGLADRRRPVHAERQRRRAALDEGARHGVRRPGSAARTRSRPHGRLRRRRADDNGGVHINSGIPNHAFYLAAVALGGIRVGEGRAHLVRDAARPGARRRRAVRRLRRADRRHGHAAVRRRGRAAP